MQADIKKGASGFPEAPFASTIVLAIEDVHRELKTETLVLISGLGPLHCCISLRVTSRGCHPRFDGELINIIPNTAASSVPELMRSAIFNKIKQLRLPLIFRLPDKTLRQTVTWNAPIYHNSLVSKNLDS